DVAKFLETDSGTIDRRPTIRSRRVCGSHTATEFNIQSLNLASMNISGVMTSGSSGSPCAHNETLGLNGQSPFRVEFKNISPTNGDLFNRVCNNYAFIIKSNFWVNQKDVDAEQHKTRDEDASDLAGRAPLIETRPDEKSAKYDSNSSKYQVGFWPIAFNIGHASILSHQASMRVKAVR